MIKQNNLEKHHLRERQCEYDANGTLLRKWQWDYAANGKLLREWEYTADGKLLRVGGEDI